MTTIIYLCGVSPISDLTKIMVADLTPFRTWFLRQVELDKQCAFIVEADINEVEVLERALLESIESCMEHENGLFADMRIVMLRGLGMTYRYAQCRPGELFNFTWGGEQRTFAFNKDQICKHANSVDP